MNKITCVSIDLINADKPPTSLAFLAGACEAVDQPYQCISLNSELLKQLTTTEYNNIYSQLKMGFDAPTDKFINTVNVIVDQIEQYGTTMVLASIFSYMQYPLAVYFFRSLKAKLPNIEIIAGGPGIGHINTDQQSNGKKLLDQQLIDFYCLGEGDTLLVDFLSGKRNIPGLNSKKTKIFNAESWVPQIDDLDSKYLIPRYKKIDLSMYHNLENKGSSIFSISTSRGCVRKCTFCSVAKSWPKYRFRSGANVANEILQHHLDVGAVHFTIVDSLINGSLKSFKDFNHEIVKLKNSHPGLRDFSYNGMFIVRDKKVHNEEFFQLMKAAGCESLAIGVETGSDRLRFDMDKKFTNDDLDHHLELCKKYGIRNTLLMFVGYPTETKEDYQATLDLLDRYQKYLLDDTIIGINHTGVFSIITDTPVYDQKDQIGIVIEDNNLSQLNWFNVNNPTLTVKERILRDLNFRKKAIELRYPIPYSDRYLGYLTHVSEDFIPMSD